MQQEEDRCARGPRDLAEERGAAPQEFDVSTRGQVGDELVVQFSTFRTLTATFAPFSNVIATSSPTE